MVLESSVLSGVVSLQVAHSPAALAQAVAAAIQGAVMDGIRRRNVASLVLTGGATPRAYLEVVARLDLPWDRVKLTLSDDRRVPPSHPDCNATMLRDCLLRGPAAAAQFFDLVAWPDQDDAQAVEAAERRLQALPRPFDLVLLGVGNDGHIASLFPGAEGVAAAIEPGGTATCCAIAAPPGIEPAVARISMTLPALLDSRRIVIAAQGISKRDAFERAVLGHGIQPSALQAMGEQAEQPVDFIWAR